MIARRLSSRTSVTERKIRSNRQAEASRKNGAKSRGPTSVKGKARSSRNSKTHGLTGKFEPTEGERDDVEELTRKLRAHYNPDDPVTRRTQVNNHAVCHCHTNTVGQVDLNKPAVHLPKMLGQSAFLRS